VAIVSDIHGNLQAFEAVVEEVAVSSCEELWCLGDLVGYGADPDACVSLASSVCSICLAGNHDLAVTGELELEDFSEGARVAAEWTRATCAPETIAFLRTLAPLNEEEAVGLYHASPRDPIWEYVLSPLQAALCMDVQSARVCLVGHSHIALSYWRPAPDAELGAGDVTGETRRGGQHLDISQGEWLLNPGSVGQPRDGDPRAAWLELDLDAWTATYHRVEYDVAEAQAAIRAARLPSSLADRLRYGQ
jgi:diadenosine tetraphosphatase ApaH/serine/threonine PP2A family protein phosphatase